MEGLGGFGRFGIWDGCATGSSPSPAEVRIHGVVAQRIPEDPFRWNGFSRVRHDFIVTSNTGP